MLSYSNVDRFIFEDASIAKKYPGLKSICDKWTLGIRVPMLRKMAQEARIEMLTALQHSDYKDLLKQKFGTDLKIQVANHHSVAHECSDASKLEDHLMAFDGFPNFSVYRSGEQVCVTGWR